jgi:hypothetical protein
LRFPDNNFAVDRYIKGLRRRNGLTVSIERKRITVAIQNPGERKVTKMLVDDASAEKLQAFDKRRSLDS